MLDWQRPSTYQLPRHKIYLTSLNQLIDRKIILQPEVESITKIFPKSVLPKKLTLAHQRTKSCAQLRARKFDLNLHARNAKNIGMERGWVSTTHMNKRQTHHQSEKLKVTYVSEHRQRLDTFSKPIMKISLAAPVPTSDPPESCESFNYSSQKMNQGYQSLQLKTERPTKQFLKKGSNLQKQVVVNLLRNKLTKQRELSQKKQYSNTQIIKMIQVFKGVTAHQDIKQKKRLVQVERKLTPLSNRLELKELKGWEQDEFLGDEDQTEQK